LRNQKLQISITSRSQGLFSFVAALALTCATWSAPAMATEEPKFTAHLTEGAFELRQYAPFLIAETAVAGDMDAASSQGFRAIADFIFGNNQAPGQSGSAKIAMTAPVTVEPRAADMPMREAQDWRVQFVMPSQYTLQTIPRPKNPAVTLREVPAKWYAVVRYPGINTQSKVEDKTAELLAWIKAKGWSPVAAPQLARYDPPWTLPFWRRSEIMVEISQP
jgi:hypothetical protein